MQANEHPAGTTFSCQRTPNLLFPLASEELSWYLDGLYLLSMDTSISTIPAICRGIDGKRHSIYSEAKSGLDSISCTATG